MQIRPSLINPTLIEMIPRDAWGAWQEANHVMLREIERNIGTNEKVTEEAQVAWIEWMEWSSALLRAPRREDNQSHIHDEATTLSNKLTSRLHQFKSLIRVGAAGNMLSKASKQRISTVFEEELQAWEHQAYTTTESTLTQAQSRAKEEIDKARTKRKVESLVGRNQIGRAIQMLMSDGPPPEVTPEIVSAMQQLHPPADTESIPIHPDIEAHNAPNITSEDLRSLADSWYDDGKAGGPSKITGAHILPLVHHDGCRRILAKLLTCITNGAIPPTSKLRSILAASRLVAFAKPGGGFRPVAMGEVVVRIATKILMRRIAQSGILPKEIFHNIQMGVGEKGGVERALHQMQSEWETGVENHTNTDNEETNEDISIALIDYTNAYNTRSRLACATHLYGQPLLQSLWSAFFLLYNTPSALIMSSRGITRAILASAQGVRQGCSMSALLYSLSMQHIFQNILQSISLTHIEAARRGENTAEARAITQATDGDIPANPRRSATAYAIMDDLTILTSGIWSLIAIKIMIANAPADVIVNTRKTIILVPHTHSISPRMRDMAREMGVQIVEGRTKLLGAVIGSGDEEVAEDIYNREISPESTQVKAIKLHKFMRKTTETRISIQSSLLLLRSSGLARMGFLCRTVPPKKLEKTAQAFDTLLHTAVADLLQLSAEERQQHHVSEIMCRPTRLGGMGLRSTQIANRVGYLASTLEACKSNGDKMMRRIKQGTIPTVKAMQQAWAYTQDAAAQDPEQLKRLYTMLKLPSLNTHTHHTLATLLGAIEQNSDGIQAAITDEDSHTDTRRRPRTTPAHTARIHQNTTHLHKGGGEPTREHQQHQGKQHIRLQQHFTRIVEQARWNWCYNVALAKAKASLDHANHTADTRTSKSKEDTDARREAYRAAREDRVFQVRMATLNDPSAGLIFNTLPTEKSTQIWSSALRIMARIRLGLPPTHTTTRCAHDHREREYAGMHNNKAYDLDGAHWLSCRACIHANGAGTHRHDCVARAIRKCAHLAQVGTIWQPALTELVSKGPATVTDPAVERRNRHAAPPTRDAPKITMLKWVRGSAPTTTPTETIPTTTTTTTSAADATTTSIQGQGERRTHTTTAPTTRHTAAAITQTQKNGRARTATTTPIREEGRAHTTRAHTTSTTTPTPTYTTQTHTLTDAADAEIERAIQEMVRVASINRAAALQDKTGTSTSTTTTTHTLTTTTNNNNMHEKTSGPSGMGGGGGGPSTVQVNAHSATKARGGTTTTHADLPSRGASSNAGGTLSSAGRGGEGRGRAGEDTSITQGVGVAQQGGANAEEEENPAQTRERASEGDLAMFADQILLVDVHIVSPLTPSDLKKFWESGKAGREDKTAQVTIKKGEEFKLYHYHRLATQLGLQSSTEDPLGGIHVKVIPAVMTPFATIGPALDKLLQKLGAITITNEIEEEVNQNRDHRAIMREEMRRQAAVARYRRIVTTACVNAVAATFSSHPQRVNVARQLQQGSEETGRVGEGERRGRGRSGERERERGVGNRE
jgi:hypothetical protein